MYFLLKMGDIPASYVSLPEGSLVKFGDRKLNLHLLPRLHPAKVMICHSFPCVFLIRDMYPVKIWQLHFWNTWFPYGMIWNEVECNAFKMKWHDMKWRGIGMKEWSANWRTYALLNKDIAMACILQTGIILLFVAHLDLLSNVCRA